MELVVIILLHLSRRDWLRWHGAISQSGRVNRPWCQHWMLRRSGRLLGCKLGSIIAVQWWPHVLLLHLRIMIVGVMKSPEDADGILEHHALCVALTAALRFDTIGTNGLFLATFNPALATC